MRVTITPEKAGELLAMNTNNRNMNKAAVKKYADDMREGLWQYNGDPIRVSATNVLLDGQHRLQACVQSGVSFECELIENLPDEVRPTIDTGRKRSAADVLNIMTGSSMANGGIAAAGRQVLNYVCGMHPSQSQSTPAIVRLLQRYPDITESYRLASKCNGILVPGPLAAILFIGTRQPTFEKRAKAFVEAVKSGADMQEGDPRLAIREAFINKRMGGAGNRIPNVTWCFIATARAWNAWVTGRELQRILVKPNEDGTLGIPDILGGPARGGGLKSLDDVRLHPPARRALADLESEVGISAA